MQRPQERLKQIIEQVQTSKLSLRQLIVIIAFALNIWEAAARRPLIAKLERAWKQVEVSGHWKEWSNDFKTDLSAEKFTEISVLFHDTLLPALVEHYSPCVQKQYEIVSNARTPIELLTVLYRNIAYKLKPAILTSGFTKIGFDAASKGLMCGFFAVVYLEARFGNKLVNSDVSVLMNIFLFQLPVAELTGFSAMFKKETLAAKVQSLEEIVTKLEELRYYNLDLSNETMTLKRLYLDLDFLDQHDVFVHFPYRQKKSIKIGVTVWHRNQGVSEDQGFDPKNYGRCFFVTMLFGAPYLPAISYPLEERSKIMQSNCAQIKEQESKRLLIQDIIHFKSQLHYYFQKKPKRFTALPRHSPAY